MENGAQALLIAGGVLLGIIIITIIILGYNNISNYYASKEEALTSKQLTAFNKQYDTYARNDVRGTELLTLVNKIINFNNTAESNNEKEINIQILIPTNDDKYKQFYYNQNTSSNILIRSGYTYNHENINSFLTTANNIEQKYPSGMAKKLAQNLNTLLGNNATKTRDDLLQQLKINYNVDNYEIIKYYQYLQFKRAHFNCQKSDICGGSSNESSGLTYDEESGRVLNFKFVFNGKFE